MPSENFYHYEDGQPGIAPRTLEAAVELLGDTQDKITGDRQDDYGDPRVNFARIATMWEAYLGTEVTAADVAALFMLAKLSRLAHSIDHEDSWVDLAGYAALGGALKGEG